MGTLRSSQKARMAARSAHTPRSDSSKRGGAWEPVGAQSRNGHGVSDGWQDEHRVGVVSKSGHRVSVEELVEGAEGAAAGAVASGQSEEGADGIGAGVAWVEEVHYGQPGAAGQGEDGVGQPQGDVQPSQEQSGRWR